MIRCQVHDHVLHVIFPKTEGGHQQFLRHMKHPEKVYLNPDRCHDVLRASERYEGANGAFVGFNFPASVVTKEERTLFPYISLFAVQYVIAYMYDDEDTVAHELRHARFHMDPVYRQRVQTTWRLLRQRRPDLYRSITRKFREDGYAHHVFVDEFQAYYPDLIL